MYNGTITPAPLSVTLLNGRRNSVVAKTCHCTKESCVVPEGPLRILHNLTGFRLGSRRYSYPGSARAREASVLPALPPQFVVSDQDERVALHDRHDLAVLVHQ